MEWGPGLCLQLPGAALRAEASEVQCPQAPGLPELWPQAGPTLELSPSVRGLSELMTLRRSWQHSSRGSVGTMRVKGVADCPDGVTKRPLLEMQTAPQACEPSGRAEVQSAERGPSTSLMNLSVIYSRFGRPDSYF